MTPDTVSPDLDMNLAHYHDVVQIKCSLHVSMGLGMMVFMYRKLLGNNILQDVSYWCALQKSILGDPWEINGVHIVVGVNNILNVSPQ